MGQSTKSEKIHASLKHPVIDGDGHVIEYRPLFEDYLLEVAGRELTDRWRKQNLDARGGYNQGSQAGGWYSQSEQDRVDRRTVRPPFWATPTRNTRELATAMMPKLLAERMDEIGIDIAKHKPHSFADLEDDGFDLIVSLSPEAHHSALEFTRGTAAEVEYWPMPDPSAVEGSRETRLDAYRHTRDQVLARLKARFGIPITPSV